MAGGLGTRLGPAAADIPKPMLPIMGKPILEYQIESLKNSGVDVITLVIGHLGHLIREYCSDGSKWGVRIEYISEDQPLGTAGALYYLKGKVREDFLLLYGDLMLDVDWNRFMEFHRRHNALITLYGHPNGHPYDSDALVVDGDGRVIRIEAKNTDRGLECRNFVNAGIYCASPGLLDAIRRPEKMDLEKGVIAKLLPGKNVFSYRCTEYIKDMGTPERLKAVSADVKNGIVAARNMKNKQRAVFLDRDGTVNVWKGFIRSRSQLELLPGAAKGIRKINASPYLTIVATNQPVAARGECTLKELAQIHIRLEALLGQEGAYIDDLFFCPHHPDRGFEGEIPELKTDCTCRKPKTGMLSRAAELYNIDLSRSWYIGDTTVDIQTGKNAGMRTILLHTGEAGKDRKYDAWPDYEAENLSGAADIILQNEYRERADKEDTFGLQTEAAGVFKQGNSGAGEP